MRFFVFFLLTAWIVCASDWPRYRGVNGAGVSADEALPSQIGKDRNVVWVKKLLPGNSSPIIVGGRVYLTGHEGDDRVLLCLDAATGEEIWRQAVKKVRTETPHPLNGPTTPTPATDGERVFVFYPEVGLLAYDGDGNQLWRRELGPFGAIQGMAVSPVYAEGRVFLLVDTPEQSYLEAFNAKDGKTEWKAERTVGFMGSYSTPSVWDPEQGPVQIVAAGASELTGYRADTGERLWWVKGVTGAPAALPLVDGGSVWTVEPADTQPPSYNQLAAELDKNKNSQIEMSELEGETPNQQIWRRIFRSIDTNTGNKDGVVTEAEFLAAFSLEEPVGGLVRTRLDGKGDVTKSHVVWKHTKGLPYVTAPLLYQGVLYIVRNGGILSAFDPETGKLLRQDRLKAAIGDYYASPVAADGKLFLVSKEGKISVLEAGRDWKVLHTADLEEEVIATPAIANGRIYLRTAESLYCFGEKPAR